MATTGDRAQFGADQRPRSARTTQGVPAKPTDLKHQPPEGEPMRSKTGSLWFEHGSDADESAPGSFEIVDGCLLVFNDDYDPPQLVQAYAPGHWGSAAVS